MKSIKVSDDVWKAVKVFCAEHNWTIQKFTDFALREKIQREMCNVESKESV